MPRGSHYRIAVAVATALLASPALAHEFWLEPRDFTVEPGERLEAEIKVGQNFKGNAYSYVPGNFTRFDVVTSTGALPVASRIGDQPAVGQEVPGGDGLAILVHETTDSLLTYSERETFETFVEEEGLDGTLERHAERGLPATGFREVYSRHVKSLVDTGPGGLDRSVGLPIELVVEGDPYADPVPESLTLRALLDGEPMENALVNVFVRGTGEAEAGERLRPRTDPEGRVTIPLQKGRRYLANVVDMREPDPLLADDTGAVWQSLWASTTFSTE